MKTLLLSLCLLMTACSCGGGGNGSGSTTPPGDGGGGTPIVATKFKYTDPTNTNVYRVLRDSHTSTDTRIVLYLQGPSENIRAFALTIQTDAKFPTEQLSVYIPVANRVYSRGDDYAFYALYDDFLPANQMLVAWAVNLPKNSNSGAVSFKIVKFQVVNKDRTIWEALPEIGKLEAIP